MKTEGEEEEERCSVYSGKSLTSLAYGSIISGWPKPGLTLTFTKKETVGKV